VQRSAGVVVALDGTHDRTSRSVDRLNLSSIAPPSPSTSSRNEPTTPTAAFPTRGGRGHGSSKLIRHGRCRPRSASPRFAVIVTSTTGGHPRLGEGSCVRPLPTCCSLATTINERPHAHRAHHRRPSRTGSSPGVPRPRRTSRRSCGRPCSPRRGPDGGTEPALSVGDTDDPLAGLTQHPSRLENRDCAMAIRVEPNGPRPVQHGERPGEGRQCGRAHG
jgi:hypothetical protein